jgi:hypothetical protein
MKRLLLILALLAGCGDGGGLLDAEVANVEAKPDHVQATAPTKADQ